MHVFIHNSNMESETHKPEFTLDSLRRYLGAKSGRSNPLIWSQMTESRWMDPVDWLHPAGSNRPVAYLVWVYSNGDLATDNVARVH